MRDYESSVGSKRQIPARKRCGRTAYWKGGIYVKGTFLLIMHTFHLWNGLVLHDKVIAVRGEPDGRCWGVPHLHQVAEGGFLAFGRLLSHGLLSTHREEF